MSSGTGRPRLSVSGSSALLAISVVGVVLLLLGLDTPAWTVPEAPRPPDWRRPLAEAETALAAGDVGAAVVSWREARRRALAAHTWDGLLQVGGAYRRLGEAGGFADDATATARELFLAALFRARAARSLEGVLHTADAFAELGDREVVAACLRVARALAGADPVARAHVLAAARVWNARLDNRAPR